MIEDALKSTRTLHRLIMTVALITIIFSMSISLPEGKTAQKSIIDGLIGIKFSQYETFVAEKVAEKTVTTLQPIGTKLTQVLEAGGHLVFDIDKIGEELSKPIHIGKILTKDSLLNEITNASIIRLNALNGLSLNQDLQVLVPRTDELTNVIQTFLTQNPGTGKRIDTIQISTDEFDFYAESFLPGSDVDVGIYFELLDAVNVSGAPTFSANFMADIETIPSTSFLDWLRSIQMDQKLAVIEGSEVKFGPSFDTAPTGYKSEKLGVLSLKLAEEIAKSSPANQSVSILGTNVPGSLVIFASPITLFFLAYYFFNHTSHLVRMSRIDAKQFEQFAWLPLSLITVLGPKPLSGHDKRKFHLFAGVLEVFGSSVILPLVICRFSTCSVCLLRRSEYSFLGSWLFTISMILNTFSTRNG